MPNLGNLAAANDTDPCLSPVLSSYQPNSSTTSFSTVRRYSGTSVGTTQPGPIIRRSLPAACTSSLYTLTQLFLERIAVGLVQVMHMLEMPPHGILSLCARAYSIEILLLISSQLNACTGSPRSLVKKQLIRAVDMDHVEPGLILNRIQHLVDRTSGRTRHTAPWSCGLAAGELGRKEYTINADLDQFLEKRIVVSAIVSGLMQFIRAVLECPP